MLDHGDAGYAERVPLQTRQRRGHELVYEVGGDALGDRDQRTDCFELREGDARHVEAKQDAHEVRRVRGLIEG